jgi:hypothetical protein
MVACDASLDVTRAARHLVSDLGAHAIVGPSSSQTTLDLALGYSISSGTLVMTPTALAASIADLADADLVWQAAPADDERAGLLNQQLHALESELRSERNRTELRLGIVVRDDALGRSARSLLSGIEFNARRLTDPGSIGAAVQVDAYDVDLEGQDALVARYVDFAPDDELRLLCGALALLLAPGPRARPARDHDRP